MYFTFVMESELVAIKLLNPINSATKCKVMLRSSARECCHLRRSQMGVQNIIHAEGGRRRNRDSIRTWPESGAGEYGAVCRPSTRNTNQWFLEERIGPFPRTDNYWFSRIRSVANSLIIVTSQISLHYRYILDRVRLPVLVV